MSTEACESSFIRIELSEMLTDMKRVLKMQFKEFVNSIEDCEFDLRMKKLPQTQPAVFSVSLREYKTNVALTEKYLRNSVC